MKKLKKIISTIAVIAIVGAAGASAMTMNGSYRVSGFDFRWGTVYTTGRGWTTCENENGRCGVTLFIGSSAFSENGVGSVDITRSARGAWLSVRSSHFTSS